MFRYNRYTDTRARAKRRNLYPSMFRYNVCRKWQSFWMKNNLYPSMFRYNKPIYIAWGEVLFIYIPLCSDITNTHETTLTEAEIHLYPSMFRYNSKNSHFYLHFMFIYIPLCSDITQGVCLICAYPTTFISLYVQI